jgi:hypothetical protein
MERSESSVEFTLNGLSVRLTMVGERWVARVADTVAVGASARLALTAALELSAAASVRALLADLGLLEPSIAVAELEATAAR